MRRRLLPILVAGIACFFAPASAYAGPAPFVTGYVEPNEFAGSDAAVAFDRVRAAGATVVRTVAPWPTIAPARRPAVFAPANWRDPSYRWDAFDAKIKRLVAERLEPIVAVYTSPVWARRVRSDEASAAKPSEIAAFVRAAASRYSGRVPGVPRIRYWQVYIEPNVGLWFSPQYAGGRAVSRASTGRS